MRSRANPSFLSREESGPPYSIVGLGVVEKDQDGALRLLFFEAIEDALCHSCELVDGRIATAEPRLVGVELVVGLQPVLEPVLDEPLGEFADTAQEVNGPVDSRLCEGLPFLWDGDDFGFLSGGGYFQLSPASVHKLEHLPLRCRAQLVWHIVGDSVYARAAPGAEFGDPLLELPMRER